VNSIYTLEIYIPSYNRVDWLERTISILAKQIHSHFNGSHLTICDNASPRGYDELFERCSDKKLVKLTRNYGNIGANANIANAFALAVSSKYLWVLSDSDPPVSNAVANFLSQLPSEADLFLLSHVHQKSETIRITYEEGFLELLSLGIGQMSLAIYNRDSFNGCLHVPYLYHNSSFPHLALILETLRQKGSLLVKLLPQAQMLEQIDSHGDENSNYLLATVGMPILMELMSSETAKKFSSLWVIQNWRSFYKNSSFVPHVYASSFDVIMRKGSAKARILLLVFGFARFPVELFLRIRAYF
jgi:hypothetical protein